ncbi:hypothetical protein BKA69DRAFT_35953 [Paraphysoderma sedebokerense]|nr:hypothetical protein BKA69DRAFT_35953 [Paraphysoderma sedebokerense]
MSELKRKSKFGDDESNGLPKRFKDDPFKSFLTALPLSPPLCGDMKMTALEYLHQIEPPQKILHLKFLMERFEKRQFDLYSVYQTGIAICLITSVVSVMKEYQEFLHDVISRYVTASMDIMERRAVPDKIVAIQLLKELNDVYSGESGSVMQMIRGNAKSLKVLDRLISLPIAELQTAVIALCRHAKIWNDNIIRVGKDILSAGSINDKPIVCNMFAIISNVLRQKKTSAVILKDENLLQVLVTRAIMEVCQFEDACLDESIDLVSGAVEIIFLISKRSTSFRYTILQRHTILPTMIQIFHSGLSRYQRNREHDHSATQMKQTSQILWHIVWFIYLISTDPSEQCKIILTTHHLPIIEMLSRFLSLLTSTTDSQIQVNFVCFQQRETIDLINAILDIVTNALVYTPNAYVMALDEGLVQHTLHVSLSLFSKDETLYTLDHFDTCVRCLKLLCFLMNYSTGLDALDKCDEMRVDTFCEFLVMAACYPVRSRSQSADGYITVNRGKHTPKSPKSALQDRSIHLVSLLSRSKRITTRFVIHLLHLVNLLKLRHTTENAIIDQGTYISRVLNLFKYLGRESVVRNKLRSDYNFACFIMQTYSTFNDYKCPQKVRDDIEGYLLENIKNFIYDVKGLSMFSRTTPDSNMMSEWIVKRCSIKDNTVSIVPLLLLAISQSFTTDAPTQLSLNKPKPVKLAVRIAEMLSRAKEFHSVLITRPQAVELFSCCYIYSDDETADLVRAVFEKLYTCSEIYDELISFNVIVHTCSPLFRRNNDCPATLRRQNNMLAAIDSCSVEYFRWLESQFDYVSRMNGNEGLYRRQQICVAYLFSNNVKEICVDRDGGFNVLSTVFGLIGSRPADTSDTSGELPVPEGAGLAVQRFIYRLLPTWYSVIRGHNPYIRSLITSFVDGPSRPRHHAILHRRVSFQLPSAGSQIVEVCRDCIRELSPVFDAMLYGSFSEGEKEVIQLKEIREPSTLNALFKIFLEPTVLYQMKTWLLSVDEGDDGIESKLQHVLGVVQLSEQFMALDIQRLLCSLLIDVLTTEISSFTANESSLPPRASQMSNSTYTQNSAWSPIPQQSSISPTHHPYSPSDSSFSGSPSHPRTTESNENRNEQMNQYSNNHVIKLATNALHLIITQFESFIPTDIFDFPPFFFVSSDTQDFTLRDVIHLCVIIILQDVIGVMTYPEWKDMFAFIAEWIDQMGFWVDSE